MLLFTRRGALLVAAAALSGCRSAHGEQGSNSRRQASASPTQPTAPPPKQNPALDRLRAIEAAREKLRPLHERPAKPKGGEWRAEHPEEKGQTFEQYRASLPTVPDGARRVLAVQPLGAFKKGERRVVELTAEYMRRHFQLEARVLPDAELNRVPSYARRKHPTWGDKQLLTGYLLEKVLQPALPDDAAALIAFTASDLWPGDGWNFVFGQADLRARVGVWSVYRNGDPDGGPEAFRRALLRSLRIAVHETGHMFSLEHCTAYRCVQAGVNSLEEADRSPLWLCPECEAKVAWATSSEPVRRIRAMGEFCKAQGLDREAAYFERATAAIA